MLASLFPPSGGIPNSQRSLLCRFCIIVFCGLCAVLCGVLFGDDAQFFANRYIRDWFALWSGGQSS